MGCHTGVDCQFDDEMFDVDAVLDGAWVPGPYGPGDELGSFNEVTATKTAEALARLDPTRPVKTYRLSEMLFDGFPTHNPRPWPEGRHYQQTLRIAGYQPSAEFGGICASAVGQVEGIYPNRVSTHEERVQLTYNLGTKINGLGHVGVGDIFYNGFRGPEIARTWGVTRLGNESTPPIVTRGIVLDVVGAKASQGPADVEWLGAKPVLRRNYRITVEDLLVALEFGEIDDPIAPGDVLLIRTGWRELIVRDPQRYIYDLPPGPFLRECRYLASYRPAIIGIDTWCFGVLNPALDHGNASCCHQELLMKYGIRIGEGIPSDCLVADGIFDFVFCYAAQNAKGAISGSSPPIALGQPRR
jgi:hypothetical protein